MKVKCTFLQALRLCTGCTTHTESRVIALLFFDHGTRRVEVSESWPGRSLPPGKTRYPLYRRLGEHQSRSGQVKEIPPGIRSPDRPAHSQSLYRLSYPDHQICSITGNNSWPSLIVNCYYPLFWIMYFRNLL